MNQEEKPEKTSDELVQKYLRRIQRKRKLKEQTKLTGTEVLQIYDATRVIYLLMPSTRADLEIKTQELVYDFDVPLEEEEDINPVEKTILNLKESAYETFEELSSIDKAEKESIKFNFDDFEYAPFDESVQTVYIYKEITSPWEFVNQQGAFISEMSEEEGRSMSVIDMLNNQQVQKQFLNGMVINESVVIEGSIDEIDDEMVEKHYGGGVRQV